MPTLFKIKIHTVLCQKPVATELSFGCEELLSSAEESIDLAEKLPAEQPCTRKCDSAAMQFGKMI